MPAGIDGFPPSTPATGPGTSGPRVTQERAVEARRVTVGSGTPAADAAATNRFTLSTELLPGGEVVTGRG
ncbi:hypothetical protein Q0Z83_025050 [Actinoplanes sichuanensis]|nr:hypothetical protein Q0Z83_025050 [Actinoplanes sichuanensis]